MQAPTKQVLSITGVGTVCMAKQSVYMHVLLQVTCVPDLHQHDICILDMNVCKVYVQEACCLLCCHVVKGSRQTCVTQQADRCTGVAAHIGYRVRK